jgi:D-sedoheptulose 7-phosphate isomerase
MNMFAALKEAYISAFELLNQFAHENANIELTVEIASKMADAFKNGNKIMICGNGGSAADAMHFAQEFTGNYRNMRKSLPVIHLGDATHLTCVANDFGFSEVFARGVEAFGKPGDWLICLSTSGNSKNVIRALEMAKKLKMKTVSFLGRDGGVMSGMADHEFIITANTSDRIQEMHMLILHVIIEGVERKLFPENYNQ